MSTYQGPAVVALDSGQQFEVSADLRSTTTGGRVSWGGTLSVPDVSKPVALMNMATGVLHVGEREGSFVRPDTSDWLSSPAGQFRMEILGNGDEPF
jgi:hypothetical protein